MFTCSYCGINLIDEDTTCSFCNANYSPENNPSLDFRRSSKFTMKNFIDESDVIKPIQELETYHTYDLLLCLRLARKQRTESFYIVRLYNKAIDEAIASADIENASEEAGEMYSEWTRRAWIIENILIDRMGYFPQRITDDMLEKVKLNSIAAQEKKMLISKQRQNTFRV